ncbi:MAG: hypothetical protein A2Z25_16910 [Planctomycetes bacterium RBG_16_55_9]|nr:MAG: hypothetical protein A2Z25_16910 [Planctomycetes bacterium RBG_16_55_9]
MKKLELIWGICTILETFFHVTFYDPLDMDIIGPDSRLCFCVFHMMQDSEHPDGTPRYRKFDLSDDNCGIGFQIV